VAVWDLQVDSSPAGVTKAWDDAVVAVNGEEGVNIYQKQGGACSNNCVNLTFPTAVNSSPVSPATTPPAILMAQITITHSVQTGVPIVSGINVSAQAAARYQ
jgi:hypothetical protein